MENKEFAGQFMKLCFAFDKEYKEGQMLVYLEFIAGLKFEALKYAVQKAILNSKFFPKISELIDLINEYRETIPAERQLGGIDEKPSSPEKAKAEISKLKVMIKDMNGGASEVQIIRNDKGMPPEPIELPLIKHKLMADQIADQADQAVIS